MIDRAIWKTAPPLWRDALDGRVALDRPALLRFDSDDFMTRLQAELDRSDGRDAGQFVVRPETWRSPAVGLATSSDGSVPRLFQPTHGRFYLVAGGLVCERYGLPDKVVHRRCEESTFAVVRRLEPTGGGAVDPMIPATFREFGWVAEGESGRWVGLGAASPVVPAEHRLALFPMTYLDGHRRRMLAAMIPVSARERYENAVPEPVIDDPIGTYPDDPAAALLLPGRARLEGVALALESLLALAGQGGVATGAPASVALFREAAFFALVDLAGFLVDELPEVWTNSAPADDRRHVADLLTSERFGSGLSAPTWMSALHIAHAHRNDVLDDLEDAPAPLTGVPVDQIVDAVEDLGVDIATNTLIDPFFVLVSKALAARPTDTAADPVGGIDDGADDGPDGADAPSGPTRTAGAVYVTRLVYERPRCRPPQRHVVSAASEPFRLAHFYDPDAPFRDNRIVLPIDTSLVGLRKFPKSVKMELSAQLRKQMERIQAIKLEDLDNGDIPEEKPLDLGMVCSMSIPIITICALVLLMIIVSLLNIVFFWVPLFKICLPKGST